MIQYQGRVYRPPSEADSLILQATLGCSYNECTFCGMYRDKPFRVRKLAELQAEINWACENLGDVKKIFLADGDALIAKASYLEEILGMCYAAFCEQVNKFAVIPSENALGTGEGIYCEQ